jgi:4'-phosphopantetheinyl transferase
VALVSAYLIRPVEFLNSADVALLPEVDRRRADAYARSEDRRAFVRARILLRRLLAAELGFEYAGIPILQKPHHKPRLDSGGLQFSVSHAQGWCVVALSRDCRVGIDAEPIWRMPGMNEVVSDFFPPAAAAAFQAALPDERSKVFFRWWTRIEAAIKASGRGLDHSRSCFDGVRVESIDQIPGLALAVAAKSTRPLRVAWHVPPSLCSGTL